MKSTAYTQWLLRTADDLLTEEVGDERDIISFLLYTACNEDTNPQAFDIVSQVGGKQWTMETFYKAADLVITLEKKK